jgi:hypothetical protein
LLSLAYVILPFADTAPADAITASMARFQQGGLGKLPNDWLTFDDHTSSLRELHEAEITFVDPGQGRLDMHVRGLVSGYINTRRVRDEMRQRGVQRWTVRFADLMDFDTFLDHCGLRPDPTTGRYGRWFNPLGQWDWWELGGQFDGFIIGHPPREEERGVGRASPYGNVELVATLLADAQADRHQAYPAVLVLPPGVVADSGRWLETSQFTPGPWPAETLAWLGVVSADTRWHALVAVVYARFQDHWAAGVTCHS